jgi:hypothetical protein
VPVENLEPTLCAVVCVPQVWQPELRPGHGSSFGLGRIQRSGRVSPAQPGPGGLYVSSAPVVTADSKAASAQPSTVPLGMAVVKMFHCGKLPLSTQPSGDYHVVEPDDAANWQLRLQVQFTFPKQPTTGDIA